MQPVAYVSRRQLLAGLLGVGAAAGLAACGLRPDRPRSDQVRSRRRSPPAPPPVAVRSLALRARPVEVDLGGRVVTTWAYGDTVPGTAFRATAGDRVQVAFTQRPAGADQRALARPGDPQRHGRRPGVTTPDRSPPGGSFDFDFVVPDPGTHWFHPHTGLQLDRGLYAPFIVDDPAEPGDYDAEWVVVLDDWTDGVGPSPEQIYADLEQPADPQAWAAWGWAAWAGWAWAGWTAGTSPTRCT